MQTPSFGNYLYFVTFIDDYLRHAWVYPLKAKSEVFLCFKQFLVMAENVSGCKMGTLRSDCLGEYMSSEFNAFLAKCGRKHQCTVPYTPQQNGVAERKNKSLMEMARCMVKSQSLPHGFWLQAFMCVTYVLTGVPPRHCRLSLHMRLGMAASHPLVICVFLIALHMHKFLCNNAKIWMTKI